MHLNFLSRKERKPQVLLMQATEEGWFVEHDSFKGHSNRRGEPALIEFIHCHNVQVPPAFEDAMEELWDSAWNEHAPQNEMQRRLEDLGKWIDSYMGTHDPTPA